jgi:glycosyltransferase involved in cell wall biosynthesis
VIDAHNEAVEPFVHNTWIARRLARWAARTADYTIVTNQFLAQAVSRAGGRPVILPDPRPHAPKRGVPVRSASKPVVLVVATYAPDEPIEQILLASRLLMGTTEFRFTGNYRKLPDRTVESVPQNVRFLGFLADDAYWRAMQDADAVLDLTLMNDCLVCGAYEAVAAGRPQILSRNRATMEYFHKGAVYCDPEAAAIADAIRDLFRRYDTLCAELEGFEDQLRREWSELARGFMALISSR